MTFMYLAICILMVGMFLYVKQRLALMESKIHLLSETISTMAGITMTHSNFVNELHESCDSEDRFQDGSENSSEECSENGSEDGSDNGSDDGSDDGSENGSDSSKKESLNEMVNEIKHIELSEVDEPVRMDGIVEPVKIIVSDDDVNVKQIVVDTSYESMTVKELKEKISELNGPKLKTKKEMLDYLKNKI